MFFVVVLFVRLFFVLSIPSSSFFPFFLSFFFPFLFEVGFFFFVIVCLFVCLFWGKGGRERESWGGGGGERVGGRGCVFFFSFSFVDVFTLPYFQPKFILTIKSSG